MAFAASASTKEARAFSLGPIKMQILTYSIASEDTTGEVTAAELNEAFHIIMDGGIEHTAAPTFSGNVVTLALADPGATRYGTLIVFGR